MGSERVRHNLAPKQQQQHVHEVRTGVRTESHETLVTKVHFQSFQSVICKMRVIAYTPTTIELFVKIK